MSAIVHVNNEATLYEGILSNYMLDSDGKLDRLLLLKARRWSLKEFDKAEDDNTRQAAAHPIEGHFFILRYSKTLTLNIRYIDLPLATLCKSFQILK